MQVLDTSIVGVALPAIAKDVQSNTTFGLWAVTAFAASSGVSMLLTGWLAHRIGESRLFVTAVALFIGASILCSLAPSMEVLVVARALQGLVAGPLIPLSQSLIIAHHPVERRAGALTVWSTVAVIGPIAGPLVGGWIADHLAWQWLFYINVPMGFAVIVMTLKAVTLDTPTLSQDAVDWWGILLISLAVATFQLLVERGNHWGWYHSADWLLMLAAFCISATLLIQQQRKQQVQLIKLDVFQSPSFRLGAFCLTIAYAVYFAQTTLIPFWLQGVIGLSATRSGQAVAWIGIAPLVLAPLISRGLKKGNVVTLACISFAIFAATSWGLLFAETTTVVSNVAWTRLLQGVGVALLYLPLSTLALASLPAASIAHGTSMLTFMRYTGASLGVSLSSMIWQSSAQAHPPSLKEAELATSAFKDLSAGYAIVFLALIPILVIGHYRCHTERADDDV